jgi:hypothetical protein
MKYMLVIYTNPAAEPEYGTAAGMDMMAGYQKASQVYVADGVMRAGDALERPHTATSIKVRNGKTEIMDGPFAETKETLGGYYILDCKDIDAAIRYAAMIPGANTGTVEIRPVVDLGNMT